MFFSKREDSHGAPQALGQMDGSHMQHEIREGQAGAWPRRSCTIGSRWGELNASALAGFTDISKLKSLGSCKNVPWLETNNPLSSSLVVLVIP